MLNYQRLKQFIDWSQVSLYAYDHKPEGIFFTNLTSNNMSEFSQQLMEPSHWVFMWFVAGRLKLRGNLHDQFESQHIPSDWSRFECEHCWWDVYWLVVEPYPSERYEFVNWDEYSQLNGKIKHVPVCSSHHQPVDISFWLLDQSWRLANQINIGSLTRSNLPPSQTLKKTSFEGKVEGHT